MSFYQFVAAVKDRGIARLNRYEVDIIPPQHPRIYDMRTTTRLTSLFCSSATIPGRGVSTSGYNIYGETRQVAYERTFEPLSLTFYVDSDMSIKRFFDRWMDCIVNPTTRSVSYYNSYIGTMNIKSIYTEQTNVQADEWSVVRSGDDAYPYIIELYEVFPKTISNVEMSYGSRDIMTLSVSFAYKYYKVIPDDLLIKTGSVPSPVNNAAPIPPAGQTGILADGSGVSTWTGDISVPSSSQGASDISEMSIA